MSNVVKIFFSQESFFVSAFNLVWQQDIKINAIQINICVSYWFVNEQCTLSKNLLE